MKERKKIVILGAGYAGLAAAFQLQNIVDTKDISITLIDRNSYHQNCISLHEVAMGNATPEEIMFDICDVIDNDKVDFIKAEVKGLDQKNKIVQTSKGDFPYDILVNGLGFVSETFGIQGMEENSLHITNILNSENVVSHIEQKFKKYAQSSEEEKNPADITIVVGGGGLTGIELLGETIDRLPKICHRYGIDRQDVKIYCVEAMGNILPMFNDEGVAYVREYLEKNGVTFLLNTPIIGCMENGFRIKVDGEEKDLLASTLIWTAGVRGNRLMDKLFPEEAKRGRVIVNADLRAPSNPDMYIIGDVAAFIGEGEQRPYPPTGQIATQMGIHCAKNIKLQLEGKPTKPFAYKSKGVICSLGTKNAIADVGGVIITGAAALKLKRVVESKSDWQISGIKNAIKKTRLLK